MNYIFNELVSFAWAIIGTAQYSNHIAFGVGSFFRVSSAMSKSEIVHMFSIRPPNTH